MEYFQFLWLREDRSGGWSIFRFCGCEGGLKDGVFSDCAAGEGVGVVGGAVSDVVTARGREWWVDYFQT